MSVVTSPISKSLDINYVIDNPGVYKCDIDEFRFVAVNPGILLKVCMKPDRGTPNGDVRVMTPFDVSVWRGHRFELCCDTPYGLPYQDEWSQELPRLVDQWQNTTDK